MIFPLNFKQTPDIYLLYSTTKTDKSIGTITNEIRFLIYLINKSNGKTKKMLLTLCSWKWSGRNVSGISCSGLTICGWTCCRKPSSTPLNVNFLIVLSLYDYFSITLTLFFSFAAVPLQTPFLFSPPTRLHLRNCFFF